MKLCYILLNLVMILNAIPTNTVAPSTPSPSRPAPQPDQIGTSKCVCLITNAKLLELQRQCSDSSSTSSTRRLPGSARLLKPHSAAGESNTETHNSNNQKTGGCNSLCCSSCAPSDRPDHSGSSSHVANTESDALNSRTLSRQGGCASVCAKSIRNNGEDCPICLMPVTGNNATRSFDNCGHGKDYHAEVYRIFF